MSLSQEPAHGGVTLWTLAFHKFSVILGSHDGILVGAFAVALALDAVHSGGDWFCHGSRSFMLD